MFSRNKFNGMIFKVKNASQVEDIFTENYPDRQTFIVPTLNHCLEKWFKKYFEDRQATKGAFFIIYTDGQFNDTEEFEELITSTCKRIDNEGLLKIFIIGIGSEIKNKVNRDYFESLNKNFKKNVDKNGNPCDIVGFAIADDMGDIIEVLEEEMKQNGL